MSSSNQQTETTTDSQFTTTLKSIYNTVKKNASLSVTVSYYVLYILFPGLLIGLILLYILYSQSILAKDIRGFFTFTQPPPIFDVNKPPGGNFI
jgi:hypothetical protein